MRELRNFICLTPVCNIFQWLFIFRVSGVLLCCVRSNLSFVRSNLSFVRSNHSFVCSNLSFVRSNLSFVCLCSVVLFVTLFCHLQEDAMNPKVLIMVAGVTTLTCYLASNCMNVRIFESLTNGKSDNECYNRICFCIKIVIASHTIVILTLLVTIISIHWSWVTFVYE